MVRFDVAFEGFLAVVQIFFALVFLEPGTDLVLGLWGFDELEPVAVWSAAVFGAQDLDGVAGLQLVIEWHDLAVDFCADALVTDLGVDAVSKVKRCGAGWQLVNFAGWREHKDGVAEELELDVVEEFLAVDGVLLQLFELLQPVELVGVLWRFAAAGLFVEPVGSNTVFGDLVHLKGTNLDLKAFAARSDDGGVQGLVKVWLWHGDVVFDAAWHWFPQGMHEAEHDVAILHGVDEDADGDEVVDLIEVFVLVDHLAVDAVEMFWSAGDLVFEVDGVHFPAQIADDFVDVFQAFLALHGNALNEVVVDLWLEISKREVFELPFELDDTETVCQRRIDLQCFLSDAFLLLWRLETHGAHVVQSVGELDDDDADILRHGDEHLAIAFKLSLFFGMALDLVELGDAFNEKGDFLVEFALEIEAGAVGVFDDIVQKPGGDGVVIEPEIGQDDGDVYWVDDVRFTGFAILAFVHFAGKFVGFLDHDAVCLWVIFQNDLDEVVVSNLMAHGFTSLPCQFAGQSALRMTCSSASMFFAKAISSN